MHKFVLLAVLFLISFGPVNADGLICIELPNRQQLPVSRMNCIYQDSDGYIWYGTEGGGICRDDGYTVSVFRSDYNNPELLKNNHITCIGEDQYKRIWFGTNRGAYILDKKDYSIQPVKDNGIEGWVISTINVFSDSTIWISAGNYVHRYNLQAEKEAVYAVEWEGFEKNVVQMYEDRNGNKWLLQKRGSIFRYDKTTDSFVDYSWPFAEYPQCIVQDNVSDNLWIGTWGKGIVRFDPREKESSQMFTIQQYINEKEAFDKKKINSIVQDIKNHNLWVTTYEEDELYVFEVVSKDTLQIKDLSGILPEGKKILSQITTDHSGNLWVSGHYPSSFVIFFDSNDIVQYDMSSAEEKLGFPVIPTEIVYENGDMWIRQRGKGLYIYQPVNDTLLISRNRKLGGFIRKSANTSGIFTVMSDSIVLSMQRKDDRIIESKITTVPTRPQERIRVIHEDSFGNLFIGTTYRLFKYSLNDNKLSSVCEDTGIINDIGTSADGNIYVLTESNGFIRISENGDIYIYGTKNENYLNLTVAPDRKVWVGSQQGGVYCYDPDNENFVSRTKDCALNGDIISALKVDRQGYLWILTERKITIFNPENNSTHILRNDDPSILCRNFLSLFEDKLNNMYVGGTGSVLSLSSLNFSDVSPVKNSIKLSAVSVNGEVRIRDYSDEKIVLKPNERNIELFFSTNDPLNADKIRYAFRYKGKNSNWNYLPDKQNSIYLTELAKGNYELEVSATYTNGLWSSNLLVVNVLRLPAWYETWWAYTLYALFFTMVLFFFIRIYIKYQKEKQKIRVEEQVAEMKYRFFTNISHELRTPLTLIINPLEATIKKVSDVSVKKQLEFIEKNAHNLLNLVNQLLDFRKIEMGGEKLILNKGDLNSVTASVYENFRFPAEEKGVQLTYLSEFPSFLLYFDADKIRKVINNLLSNAVKFTEKGGSITISLTLVIQKNREYAAISVQDNGKGIAEDKLPHIFKRFHQVNVTEGNTGSGIGLHLVKEYIEMHQGHVTVKSIEGQGAEFTVYIPIDLFPDGKQTMDFAEPEKEKSAMVVSSVKQKILIVEDNEDFRTYLKEELENYYSVYEASDGIEAEKKVSEILPDIIITDLMMPHMNGIELCHRIKTNIETSHIPVILLTASENTENEKRGYEEGADAYITKPFRWEILFTRIQVLIEQKLKRQHNFNKNTDIDPSSIAVSSLDEQFLKKVMILIEENLANSEYSIEDLSRDMAMSRVNLYRKIHSITGNSPTEFFKIIRLKRAAELLAKGEMTVVEVAYSVGFNTPSYFTKSFKKMFGVVPTQFIN